MGDTVELPPELVERLEQHLEDDETIPEFVEELLNMFESESRFLQEGYSE